MIFRAPGRNRGFLVFALDLDRWVPFAVAGALVALAVVASQFSTAPVTRPAYADKFEWLLMEPQADGRTLATRYEAYDSCAARLEEVAATQPEGVANPTCVPGDLIE